jgi:branched-chain amino acid aminotransferase
MPEISFDLFSDCIITLVDTDRSWVPDRGEDALYIRPIMYASEGRVGLKIADEYHFVVICSPVGRFYGESLKLLVETSFHRAGLGGTGYAKCAGNYGGAFYPSLLAKKQGFDQVIWTSAGPRPCLDESGSMNIFIHSKGTLITPALSDTILDGITRKSLISIAKLWGISVEERSIPVDELVQGLRDGNITEVFGAGTAAVVSPATEICVQNECFSLPKTNEYSFSTRARKFLNDLRKGAIEDVFHWNTTI